jgi:hypothetical protein
MRLRGEARGHGQSEELEEALAGGFPDERSGEGEAEPTFHIDRMIAGLPPGMREAAVLCLEEGLAPSAAAEVLGLKPATMRKRIHDARARLQRLIVAKAKRQLQMHLLPGNFAEKCVCRCAIAVSRGRRRPGKEVTKMAKNESCGCGCLPERSKRKAKPRAKSTKRKK